MKSLFYIRPEIKITGSGISVKINNDFFTVQDFDKIDNIMITAKSGYISLYALKIMAIKRITLTLHNMNGLLLYHIIPEYPNKSIDNRILQYKQFIENREQIASKIVSIKKQKYNEMLKEYNMPLVTNDNEAVFSNEYFAKFQQLITDYGYEYTGRKGLYYMSNQKAINIINATMNLFYGYIEHKLLNQIAYENLDYNISFLHEPQYNKLPLTYDLIEMLRADIDKIVLDMAQNRFIQKRHFELSSGYYLLKEQNIKRYIKNIEPLENKTNDIVKDFINILSTN